MSDIKLFESKHIRSLWDETAQRLYFAIGDVMAALTESQNPQVYWRVLKKRLLAEGDDGAHDLGVFLVLVGVHDK